MAGGCHLGSQVSHSVTQSLTQSFSQLSVSRPEMEMHNKPLQSGLESRINPLRPLVRLWHSFTGGLNGI